MFIQAILFIAFLATAAWCAPAPVSETSLNAADFLLPEGITVDNLPPGVSPSWPIVRLPGAFDSLESSLERRQRGGGDCACYESHGIRCCTVCSYGCGGACTIICS